LVDPGIDAGFAAIVTKAMARDPAHRFQTAREFQQALAQWGAGQGPLLATALKVPAAAPLAGSALRPPQPHVPTLGTGTPGAWSQTGPTLDAPPLSLPKKKKSNLPLFAGLGAGALLLLAGGGFVAMNALQNKKPAGAAAAAAAAADASARAAAEQAERERVAKLEAEKAAAEAEAKQAEAEKAAAEAEAKRAEAQAAASASAAVTATATAAPRPAPAARPAPAHEASRPSSGVSGGRKIRTSL
jgi:hypothetical protein